MSEWNILFQQTWWTRARDHPNRLCQGLLLVHLIEYMYHPPPRDPYLAEVRISTLLLWLARDRDRHQIQAGIEPVFITFAGIRYFTWTSISMSKWNILFQQPKTKKIIFKNQTQGRGEKSRREEDGAIWLGSDTSMIRKIHKCYIGYTTQVVQMIFNRSITT